MSTREQTIALSAVLQHCRLVDQLAMTGSVDYSELDRCLQQLFIVDYQDSTEAFADLQSIQPGILLMTELLERNADERGQAVLQYAVALIHLERKLSAKTEMLQIIRSRLEHASYRNTHFASDRHAVAESIAGIYQDTLSTLAYRIQVKGNMKHLQDPNVENYIRALLLCAVRALRIWRLEGGSRFKLLLRRGQYVKQASLIAKTG